MKRLAAGLGALMVLVVLLCGLHAGVNLQFDRTITVDAPVDATWDVLRLSFLDSSKSPVWPRELETIRADALKQGATVEAVYHMPVIGDVPQTYTLADYHAGDRTLRYATSPSHPLAGGATVSVETADGETVVRWTGEYDVSWSPRSQVSALFTRYFVGGFFDELERGLRKWSAERATWAGE